MGSCLLALSLLLNGPEVWDLPGGPRPGLHTIEVTASRYAFDPSTIEVMAGEPVRLLLRSADTTHGLKIEALGVEVVIPKGGDVVSLEFVAGGPGRYLTECSEYCGSGHRRMKGELVVREANRDEEAGR